MPSVKQSLPLVLRCVLICISITVPARIALAQGPETNAPILVLDAGGHTDGIPGLAFSPDAKKLFSASRDKTADSGSINSILSIGPFILSTSSLVKNSMARSSAHGASAMPSSWSVPRRRQTPSP